MGKILKRIGLVAVTLALTGGVAVAVMLSNMAASTGVGNAEVADYDSRIEIWERPAGYSTERKLDHMNVDRGANAFIQQILFASAIVNEEYRDQERTIDTFTYLYEVEGGYEAETYEDIPYVVPYLCEGSDSAVIVVPGGGFGFKSMDGSDGEGRDVAVALQDEGVSAFILHYRSNPYEYPIPQLDLQRAVRYLRFHAEEFGIDPNKIGVIGFSAGGFEVACLINQIQGNDCFPDGYVPDEVDGSDDRVVAAAMIYPALSFNNNVPMLFALFNGEDVRNPDRREELLLLVDMKRHVGASTGIPQFVAWGTRDTMVGITETPAYVEAARAAGVDVTEVVVEGEDHGFGQEFYMRNFIEWFRRVASDS